MYDFQGKESAIDAVADIIEPVALILADKEIQQMQSAGVPLLKMLKPAIKNHKKEVIEILARLETEEGMEPDEYIQKVGLLTVPKAFLDLLNMPEIATVFSSQGQNKDATSSGSAMENTEVSES